MKRTRKIIFLFIAVMGIAACDDVLDLQSLSEPTDATFFSNEEELDMGLTGVYRSVLWQGGRGLPVPYNMDNAATDLGVVRGGMRGFDELGSGVHSATTRDFQTIYSELYRGVGRANNLLQNMDRAAGLVSDEKFDRIRGEALVLRAYFYHHLIELWGDVPYTEVLITNPKDALLPRESKSVIADKLLADLQTAADLLPETAPDPGRVTRYVALGLHARIALYNEKYTEAAASAKAVIDANVHPLHPDYKELFEAAGQTSSEVMFEMPFLDGVFTHSSPRGQGSRCLGGYSTIVPTQALVDSYEATDGLPIDESAVYDPTNPYENRDPRLKASIITPQSEWAGRIFESHLDSMVSRNVDGSVAGDNFDNRNVAEVATFCGYLWRKYTDEVAQVEQRSWSDLNFSLMRFAEILLIYAEARIESNNIDASVLEAINRVRARAYGVDVTDISNYPAITTTDQAELRKVIRRERKVELANEGFRLYDIRRWRIAAKVVPVVIYGRPQDFANATLIPEIDDDCFVSYEGVESQYDRNTSTRFPNAQNRVFNDPRDYLLPIPQAEIDTYAGLGATLEQNPGGY